MLSRVDLVTIDVSDDRIASIIKVTIIGELGTTFAVTSNRNTPQKIYNTSSLRVSVARCC
jgi:hypothetical protein